MDARLRWAGVHNKRLGKLTTEVVKFHNHAMVQMVIGIFP